MFLPFPFPASLIPMIRRRHIPGWRPVAQHHRRDIQWDELSSGLRRSGYQIRSGWFRLPVHLHFNLREGPWNGAHIQRERRKRCRSTAPSIAVTHGRVPLRSLAATNPHGTLSAGNAVDAADKEFIDVDPDTGRVLISWSNFTATTIEIRSAYTDSAISATPPTWSAGVVVDSGNMTGSVPRFAGNGSPNAYIAYGVGFNTGDNIRVAKSTDNGVSWSAP